MLDRKLISARLYIILLGLMLVIYLSTIIIARSFFSLGIFILLLSLGVIALALTIKALLESRSDVEKSQNDKNI